jgi:diacylglycerol kinase family enzyme
VQRVALIVNPLASRVTPSVATAVERALARVGSVETLLTEATGHATELARGSTDRADALVVFSGDGGFNEVLNGVDGALPVGFVPGGGSSVLPRALGLPREPVAAAERIAAALDSGRTRRISLGRVNGRRFGFASGVGLDAEVVRRVDAIGRADGGRRPGDVQFARALFRAVAERRGRFAPALEIRGVGRAAFALVANTDPYTYFGALPVHFAPRARFELGLDVAAPASVRAYELPILLGAALVGSSIARRANIRYLHDVEAVELECDRPMPLHVDGEDLGNVDRAVFAAERGVLDVLV